MDEELKRFQKISSRSVFEYMNLQNMYFIVLIIGFICKKMYEKIVQNL